jgi:hypothetical protein
MLNSNLRGDFMDNCCEGYCKRCRGMMMSLFGLLIIIKVAVLPDWLGPQGDAVFIGLLLIIGGIWKSIASGCSCNKENCCSPKEHPKAETKTETAAPVYAAKKEVKRKK